MKLLQNGMEKSGNLWLYRILSELLILNKIETISFIQNHPAHNWLKSLDLSYKDQADIDMLDIENSGFHYRVSSVLRVPLEKIHTYVENSSHVWTHSMFCNRSYKVYNLFDKLIYIIRDPRDRAVSEANFAFTPYMQKYFPHNETSVESYLENRMDMMMQRWFWHVYDHLRYSRKFKIHFVFYERLLNDPLNEVKSLNRYLGFNNSENDLKLVLDRCSFLNMKSKSPGHLRKGKAGNWKDVMNEEQKARASELTDTLLKLLNYPESESENTLPGLNKNPDKAQMEELIALKVQE